LKLRERAAQSRDGGGGSGPPDAPRE